MNIYLPDYCFGNQMLMVARNEAVYQELMCRNCDTMFIQDEQIVFQPGDLRYPIDPVKTKRLDQLHDYDIVEISENGLLYRAFANQEADTTIFLGAKCNSNCIMCPASDTEREKGFTYSRDFLMKYIDYLPPDLEYIVITGGEPTMQTELFLDVLNKVKAKYPFTQILLLTNGRSLSDEGLFRHVAENHPNHFRIAIPIHAATAELHDAITRSPGSFDQTILALTRLMESDISIEIRIVVTKINCDNLLEIAKLITSRFPKVEIVNFIGLEPRGNCALNFDTVYIDHKASFAKSKSAIDHLVAHGYDVGLYNYPLCAVDRDYWSLASKSISGYKNVYHDDCNKCDVKSICGGFFTAAMSIAKPSVFPVTAKEWEND